MELHGVSQEKGSLPVLLTLLYMLSMLSVLTQGSRFSLIHPFHWPFVFLLHAEEGELNQFP